MPTFPEIAFNLGAAIAAIWIGGIVLISSVGRTRAWLRHHRPAICRHEHAGDRPVPARDL